MKKTLTLVLSLALAVAIGIGGLADCADIDHHQHLYGRAG